MIFFRLIQFLLILVAPFVLLVRSAVFVHSGYGTHPWISVLGGAVLTAVLLFLYLTFLRRKMTRKRSSSRGRKLRMALAVFLVTGFAFQGLMFVSARNVKNTSLQREFRELHPILRLGVSTIFMIDRKAIMTDAQRSPGDYERMGLKKKQNSLHYRQEDGYVYALDLRTRGRAEWQNLLTRLYFRLMGFQTLRHMGTGDHLHVSLKNPARPWAK